MCSVIEQPTPPPASAGPRVSDEEMGIWLPMWQRVEQEGKHPIKYPEGRAILDLADSRTALAAANARIAVLEAERDGLRERDMRVQMIAVPLGKVLNTDEHLRQLWRQYDDDGSVDESVITTALGDLAGAIDELYDACYDTVHAHRAPHERNPARAATASPEPGAAHE